MSIENLLEQNIKALRANTEQLAAIHALLVNTPAVIKSAPEPTAEEEALLSACSAVAEAYPKAQLKPKPEKKKEALASPKDALPSPVDDKVTEEEQAPEAEDGLTPDVTTRIDAKNRMGAYIRAYRNKHGETSLAEHKKVLREQVLKPLDAQSFDDLKDGQFGKFVKLLSKYEEEL